MYHPFLHNSPKKSISETSDYGSYHSQDSDANLESPPSSCDPVPVYRPILGKTEETSRHGLAWHSPKSSPVMPECALNIPSASFDTNDYILNYYLKSAKNNNYDRKNSLGTYAGEHDPTFKYYAVKMVTEMVLSGLLKPDILAHETWLFLRKNRDRGTEMHCGFCYQCEWYTHDKQLNVNLDKDESKAFWRTHNTKVKEKGNKHTIVICPYLRTFVCRHCHATGNNAHTSEKCPNKQPMR